MHNAPSPFPTPVVVGELITTGLFAVARHPIFTSLLFYPFPLHLRPRPDDCL